MRARARQARPEETGALALPAGSDMGAELYELAARLYPIPRSLTGEGVRETLAIVRDEAGVELETVEIPSGTPLYDWNAPQEWRLRDAHVSTLDGERVIDLADSNLHVVGYSVGVRQRMTREALDEHLHSLPEEPDRVPYRTAYWASTWGFCVAHNVREAMTDVEYDVVIEAEHVDGSLTFGERLVRGLSPREVLLSCNICHPSLANDGASGIALTALLAREIARCDTKLTYRFLFSPGTLGPLAWLSRNEAELDRLQHGLVVSCVGDEGPLTYKRSRASTSATDRVVTAILDGLGLEHRIEDFVPWGGDERQFCSPGFDLPVGVLSRTPHGRYPEYHTSADDMSLLSAGTLAESWDAFRAVLDGFETNTTYESTSPKGEPQLGRRGLYRRIGAGLPGDTERLERARLWVLNLADGKHDLAAIVERSGLPWSAVALAARELENAGLLRASDGDASEPGAPEPKLSSSGRA